MSTSIDSLFGHHLIKMFQLHGATNQLHRSHKPTKRGDSVGKLQKVGRDRYPEHGDAWASRGNREYN